MVYTNSSDSSALKARAPRWKTMKEGSRGIRITLSESGGEGLRSAGERVAKQGKGREIDRSG